MDAPISYHRSMFNKEFIFISFIQMESKNRIIFFFIMVTFKLFDILPFGMFKSSD